ncbi:hypothetical protein MNBD_ALPHA06-1754 [hydrothermal vent metagenome]|uniref:Sensory transduction regulator n=1 Tax=hydrothermal vent metagenome TaxID=652676 RepID=A0A3B0S081_9ZZZZ
MRWLALILVCFGIFWQPALGADTTSKPQSILSALSMTDLGETLDLLGLAYEPQKIDGQKVVANTRLVVADGVTWFVYGYNCQDGEDICSEFQMRAVLQTQKNQNGTRFDLEQWNRDNRFVRAYASSTGQALVLEMDVYLAGGVMLSNVTDQILLWRQSLRKFSLELQQK